MERFKNNFHSLIIYHLFIVTSFWFEKHLSELNRSNKTWSTNE